MDYRKVILRVCYFALFLSFAAQNGRAQEVPQEPANPKPAARTYPIPLIDPVGQQDDNIAQDTNNGLQPDTMPLTGVLNATLGTPEMRHSYWVPGFQYASTIQSNGYNQPNSTGWYASNYLNGNISLLKAWRGSQLAVNYSGGGVLSTNNPTQGNGYTQQLALSQAFQWNRLRVQISDQFAYLPQSGFGFGVGTNLGMPGVGGPLGPTIPGLGGGVVPNQSIYAAFGPQYSNAGVIQSTYVISPRGSVTASGSYGILRFVDPGNFDNNSVGASLGYNYQINREDTIGVVFRFSSYQYPGHPQALGDHIVNLAYGRKITGHLALQIYAGPEFTTLRVPIGTQSSKLGGNASANLTYGLENGSLSASYYHGLTGGSGVFNGSTLDQVNFGASRRLGRIWTANINFGYAHNKAAVNPTQASLPTYNSWFVGGGVNRPLGTNLNFAMAYTAYINASNQPGCTGASCSSNQTSNSITLNLQWHTRPFVLP
jgi:hypothetical protein